METLLWALGILVTIQIAVTGFLATKLWAHVVTCTHNSATVARIDADVERMKQDIGTHESGLRGNVHQTANLCMQHEMRIATLERHEQSR